MTTFGAEFASHPLVRAALSAALSPTSESELLHLVSHARLTRTPPGAPILLDATDELRVVVLGIVAMVGAPATDVVKYLPGQILPASSGTARVGEYRAHREVVVAHVPFEALEGWGGHRILRTLVQDARVSHARPPLLVGISGVDHDLASEFHHALAEALKRHGTVSVARVDVSGPMPSRLALADLVPPADFQLCLFRELGGPSDVPAVDRWLHVVDGGAPAEGRPMPRRRVPGYVAAVRPGEPVPLTPGSRLVPVRGEAGLAPHTLILSHDRSVSLPRRTARHLAFYHPDDHRHVRRKHPDAYARLARELAGVPVGFTLGAGGARGLAHLGVFSAAEEHGIPVDQLSGTSIGAVIGALVGMGYDAAARREAAERMADVRPFKEFTLPTTALLRGSRFEALADEFFGGVDLEDLWVPLVTMSCELGEFRETVHRRGPLSEIILAGCGLPGVLPPRVLEGKLHVDGGTSDMLPVELLRSSSPGPIIAVDVSPWEPIDVPHESYPVGTSALLARLRGKPAPLGALGVFWRAVSFYVAGRGRAEAASADILICPDVGDIGTSDLEALREIESAGYVAAREAFASDAAARLRDLAIPIGFRNLVETDRDCPPAPLKRSGGAS